MADITLTITKDGLTPSVVDAPRKESLSVDFSGLDAWENSYAVENGTVYVQQFDALMRPLGEDDFPLGSFTVALKAGVCALDFRVRADSTTASSNAMYDVLSEFPVKVGGAGSGGGGIMWVEADWNYDEDEDSYDLTPTSATFGEIMDALRQGRDVRINADGIAFSLRTFNMGAGDLPGEEWYEACFTSEPLDLDSGDAPQPYISRWQWGWRLDWDNPGGEPSGSVYYITLADVTTMYGSWNSLDTASLENLSQFKAIYDNYFNKLPQQIELYDSSLNRQTIFYLDRVASEEGFVAYASAVNGSPSGGTRSVHQLMISDLDTNNPTVAVSTIGWGD